MESFLGIDIGTSAIKASLVRIDGFVVAEAQIEQQLIACRPNWTEQHPETWWQNTKLVICKIMKIVQSVPEPVTIKAIGFSGQMHSSVFLDAKGDVIRPALLWNDARTSEQCRQITNTIGIDGLYKTVGNLALEGFTAPKILWMRQHEPDNYKRLKTVMLAKDYVRFRMTGEISTDPSDASGTILYDIRNRIWSQKTIQSLNIDPSFFPNVINSTDIAGNVSSGISNKLDIPANLPVICGGADNAVSAVATGITIPGLVQSSIGTSGTMLSPINRPVIEKQMRLHTFCHCIPDSWYVMGTILSAGNSLKWLRTTIGGNESYDSMMNSATHVNAGSEGLIFLPYLSGERTPHNDPNARGVFFGLNLNHTKAHLTRSILEGVCFALKDSLDLMTDTGISIKNIRSTGGGSQNRLWQQIQADVFGIPVTRVPRSGPAYGAAMLAALGTKQFKSVKEIVAAWIREDETVEPDSNINRIYTEHHNHYKSLYPSLKTNFAEMRPAVEGTLDLEL